MSVLFVRIAAAQWNLCAQKQGNWIEQMLRRNKWGQPLLACPASEHPEASVQLLLKTDYSARWTIGLSQQSPSCVLLNIKNRTSFSTMALFSKDALVAKNCLSFGMVCLHLVLPANQLYGKNELTNAS